MNRARKVMSILIVIAAFSAWLAISNHCAIGATAAEVKPAADECPFHAQEHAPKPKPKSSSESPCCKILRAVAPAPAKRVAAAIVDLAHVDFSFAKLIVVAPPKISFLSATLDTGPPGRTSFVELNRSMRAHAPPALA